MAAFLSNIRYVAWSALAVGLLFLIWYAGLREIPLGNQAFTEASLRWTHVLSGIMWIGHLYYFNFTQMPNMPKIPGRAAARHRQGDRTGGFVLVPLGGGGRPW